METWISTEVSFSLSYSFNDPQGTHLINHLSKNLLIDCEGEVQHVFDVIVLHPLEALVELLIQELQVTQVTWAVWAQAKVTQSFYKGQQVLKGCLIMADSKKQGWRLITWC